MSPSPKYPSITLTGATVAITGAARGIGRATAEAFLKAGANVVIGDRDIDIAEKTAIELGPHCLAVALDVSSRRDFDAFLDATKAAFGPVEVLINNAGIMPLGLFVDESDKLTAAQINVNLWGPINGMRAALPSMIAAKRGHIVNVASLAGKTPTPGAATYSATKHAVVGLSLTVRDEVAAHGVSVSVVCPSLVNTELGSGLPIPASVSLEPSAIAKEIVATVGSRRAQAVIPRWLGAAVDTANLLPSGIQERARKLVKANDVGAKANSDPARESYLRRIEDQVTEE
jgi:short-subunit dehydrogenase